MALDNLVGFDVETSGALHEYALQPWRQPESWVTSYAVAREVTACNFGARSVLYPKPEHLRQLLIKFATKRATVVGWNTAFDVAWLVAMGLEAEVMQVRWLDAMLMLKHLRNYPVRKVPLGLKAAVAEFLPEFAGYEDDVDFHSTDPESLAKLRTYNERDATFTLRLARAFWNRLSLDQRRLVLIEAAAIPLAAIANVRGLPCDAAEATALDNKLESAAEEYLRALQLHDSTVTAEVLASPKRLAQLLYTRWGMAVPRLTAKGAQSTDKVALYGLAVDDVRVRLIRSYREAVGNRTKYTTGLLQSLAYNGDNITRPQARLFSTYTGRMTYSSQQQDVYPIGIALHQIPRRAEFRRMFVTPPGYQLLECDFSGQEFRWMAVLAQDPLMLQLCQPGEDAHGYMGAEIAHTDYRELVAAVHAGDADAKRKRQLGKVANLSCIASGQPVLTDRGYIPIEDVTISDMVWDGVEWVSHDGVVFKGVKHVIEYQGITATPDHKVLVQGNWVAFEDAARYGWQIESPLGEGWSRRGRATLRIVAGVVRRAVSTVWRAIRASAVPVWAGEGRQPAHDGGRPYQRLSSVRHYSAASETRAAYSAHAGRAHDAETCVSYAATLQQPQRCFVSQLWWTWDRVSLSVGQAWGRVDFGELARRVVRRTGLGSHRRERALRTRQFAASVTTGKPRQQATYDLLNAGPRARFSVGACIVSNCQYRTSANKLQQVATVQHGTPLSNAEANHIWSTYRRTYRFVPRYWDNQIRVAKTQGYVETVGGRRVQLESWTRETTWGNESTSINFPVQGTGADQKYLAMACVKPLLTSYHAYFAFDLHDGLFFFVPEAKAMEAATKIATLLSHLPYEKAWGVYLPVEFPVEAKLGATWGDLKEIKHD